VNEEALAHCGAIAPKERKKERKKENNALINRNYGKF